MVVTASDFKDAGIRVPLLVGGAALSEKYTRIKIAPATSRPRLLRQGRHDRSAPHERDHGPRDAYGACSHSTSSPRCPPSKPRRASRAASSSARAAAARSAPASPIPTAPYLDRKVRDCRRSSPKSGPHQSVHALRPAPRLQGQLREGPRRSRREGAGALSRAGSRQARSGGFMKVPRRLAVLRSRARRQCNPPFAPGGKIPLHTFRFGRQDREDGLCLSDYVLDPVAGRRDHLALFVVTAGEGVARRFRNGQARGRVLQGRTGSRRSPSRPPKAAPNGCIAACARIGASPTPRHDDAGAVHLPLSRASVTASAIRPVRIWKIRTALFKLLRPEEIGVQADGRLHDGARGQRQRARLPPPRLRVLHRERSRGRSRLTARKIPIFL